MKRLGLLVGVLALVGCSTHVGVVSTRREDMNAQVKVLAIAARNLEDSSIAIRKPPRRKRPPNLSRSFTPKPPDSPVSSARGGMTIKSIPNTKHSSAPGSGSRITSRNCRPTN